ncbi:MAG: DUF3786 domain-containing protein [Chloroflexi bacterium]|nr:DUF3786 domain-containing protein [Chloroflexota bacterium]MCL5074451.1 DUF3786 domain-containing protein [Chloroflexota bacterium]
MDQRRVFDTYRPAFVKACRDLAGLEPFVTAAKGDVLYVPLTATAGEFEIPYLGRAHRVSYPEVRVREAKTGEEPSLTTQILLLHYLLHADGTPLSGRWVSFRELPDGRVYDAAFRQRSVDPLARAFGADLEGFVAAARALGGEPARMADASFIFRVFPRLFLACLLWLADAELPPAANILFDAAAGHQLPTEDLSAVGGILSGRLLRPKGLQSSSPSTQTRPTEDFVGL